MWKTAVTLTIAAFALPASTFASTTFGSKLTHEPTPSEECVADTAHMCTWVATQAYQNVGHERAPKTGTIKYIKLRSCSRGTFVLQLATAFPSTKQAKVRVTGPTINYKGSSTNCNGGMFIETFLVNLPVRVGEYLAVEGTNVGFIYNSSGSGALPFDPPLADRGSLRTSVTTGHGNGILLIQAIYND